MSNTIDVNEFLSDEIKNPFEFGRKQKIEIKGGPELEYIVFKKGACIEFPTCTVNGIKEGDEQKKGTWKAFLKFPMQDSEVTRAINSRKYTEKHVFVKSSEITIIENDDEFVTTKMGRSKKGKLNYYSNPKEKSIGTISDSEEFVILKKCSEDPKFLSIVVTGVWGAVEKMEWFISKALFDSKDKWGGNSIESVDEIFENMKRIIYYHPVGKSFDRSKDPCAIVQLSTYQERDRNTGEPIGEMKIPSFGTKPGQQLPLNVLESLFMKGKAVIYISKVLKRGSKFNIHLRLISFAIFELKEIEKNNIQSETFRRNKISEEQERLNDQIINEKLKMITESTESLKLSPSEGGSKEDNTAAEIDALLAGGPTMDEADASGEENSDDLEIPGL